MATVSPAWTSFNCGELSPRLDGRVDMPQYMKGGRICLNWLPTVQGPLVRRGGARLVSLTVSNGTTPSLLLPFSRSRTESYLLEFGNQVLRFFFNGQVVLNPITSLPLTIVTPYAEQDLFNADGTPALTVAQSVDVLTITHAKYQTQQLLFMGGTTPWVLQAFTYFDGPWQDGNTDLASTLQIAGGSVGVGAFLTVNASKAVFDVGMVGSLLRIHQQDLTQTQPWQPGQKTPVIAVGVQRRSGFNTYQAVTVSAGAPPSGATTLSFIQTGGETLTHTQGNAWDGDRSTTQDPIAGTTYYSTGVQWSYQDCGYGVLQITNVAIGGLSCSGIIKRQFPRALLTQPSNLWEMSPWNGDNGYADGVTFYKGRQVFSYGIRFSASVVGDFGDFADLQFGEVLADSSLTGQCLSDKYGKIQWMSPQTALLIGTEAGEFVVDQQSTSDPFGPTNFAVTPQSQFGSRKIPAIRVQNYTLFVQQDGRVVREFVYAFVNNSWQSNDLTVSSDHITAGGIVGVAYAQNPWRIIWYALGNGKLVGFTYNPEQEVKGWHRHDLGGGAQVRSLTSIPSADGTVDDVYFCVARTITDPISGLPVTTYSIEKLEQPISTVNGDAQQDAFYVDGGLTLANTINANLNVTGDPTVVGNTCTFIASLGVFTGADIIGRYIHYDWTTTTVGPDGLPQPVATKGIAQITATHSSPQTVDAVIRQPFPQLFGVTIPANNWRMTVTSILAASVPSIWQGQTLSILGDGAVQPDLDYPTGTPVGIAINPPASVIQIGIKSPAVWQSMRPDTGDQTGAPIGKPRRVSKVTVRVLDELGLALGRTIDACDPIAFNSFDVPNNDAPPLRDGNSDRLSFNGEYDSDGRILLTAQQPLPATICALGTLMEIQEDN